MGYQTKTYIAGDWTGDKDLIEQLFKWNDNNFLSLHFVNAHEVTQARDSSLSCSIKASLLERLKVSKTFVLVVGDKTDSLTKGGCQFCTSYNSWNRSCARGHSPDYRSYINYECEMAINFRLRIVVIYNSSHIQKSQCPDILRNRGQHINGYHRDVDGKKSWNYYGIKNAIMKN